MKVRAYCIRGLFGAIFSTGMDTLAQELNKIEGVSATAEGYSLDPVYGVLSDLTKAGIASHGSGRAQVIIGHSYGGQAASMVAGNWYHYGIKTALLVIDDTVITAPLIPETGGVRIEYFQKVDLMGGGTPGSVPYATTPLERIQEYVVHTEMDKLPSIHNRIIEEVKKIVAS